MAEDNKTKTKETTNDQGKTATDQHGEILMAILGELKTLGSRVEAVEAKQSQPQMPTQQMPVPQGFYPPYMPMIQQLPQSGRQRRPGTPMIDTKTGKVYASKASAAKDVFHEYAGKVLPNGQVFKWHGWAIHDIMLLDPGRFMEYHGVMAPGATDANYAAAHKQTQTPATDADKK